MGRYNNIYCRWLLIGIQSVESAGRILYMLFNVYLRTTIIIIVLILERHSKNKKFYVLFIIICDAQKNNVFDILYTHYIVLYTCIWIQAIYKDIHKDHISEFLRFLYYFKNVLWIDKLLFFNWEPIFSTLYIISLRGCQPVDRDRLLDL